MRFPASRRSFRLGPAALVCFQLCASAAPALQPQHPDLSTLDPPVASQLRLARARRDRLLQEKADVSERAAAAGELGQLYQAYGFAAAAESAYLEAAGGAPTDPRWPHLLGILLQAEGRLDEAERAYRTELALPGASAAGRVQLARVLLEQNRPGEAESTLGPLLEAATVDPAAIACQGEIALALGQHAEAARLLDLALGLVPEATRLHHPLASALRAIGDLEEARRHLALAGEVGLRPVDPWIDRVESLPTGERAHTLRGQRAYERGRYQEALTEFEQAVAAAPTSAPARVSLAAALAATGRTPEAVAQLREALRLEPDDSTAHLDLGSLLLATGEPREAVVHLRRASELSPADGEAKLELALALAAAGNREDAMAELRALVGSEPRSIDASLTLAQWLVEGGDWPTAIRVLEQARAASPASPRIASTLGRALATAPDPALRDGARAHALALEGFAGDERATHAEVVALALAELGRCAEAAVWQREALSRLDGGASTTRRRLEENLARYQAGGASCRSPLGSAAARPR